MTRRASGKKEETLTKRDGGIVRPAAEQTSELPAAVATPNRHGVFALLWHC